MSYCEQCAALLRRNDLFANDRDGYVQLLTDENNKRRAQIDTAAEMLREAKARNTALRAEVEKLRDVLCGVLWMAEEWFNHGGDETAFSDDHEAKLEAARAVFSASQPAPLTACVWLPVADGGTVWVTQEKPDAES